MEILTNIDTMELLAVVLGMLCALLLMILHYKAKIEALRCRLELMTKIISIYIEGNLVDNSHIKQLERETRNFHDLHKMLTALKLREDNYNATQRECQTYKTKVDELGRALDTIHDYAERLETEFRQKNVELLRTNGELESIVHSEKERNGLLIAKLANCMQSINELESKEQEYRTALMAEKTKTCHLEALTTELKEQILKYKDSDTDKSKQIEHKLLVRNSFHTTIIGRATQQQSALQGYNHDYNAINAHPRDKFLSFDESEHKYTVGSTELKSVTTLVDESFPPFDADRIAHILSKQTGRSEESFIREWDLKARQSRDLGTVMHANIERFYLGEPCEINDVFIQFFNFTQETKLIPYRTEWAIYDEEMGIAGTLDFLDYQNGEYTIYDWKRSKNIVTKTGKKILKSKSGAKGYSPISSVEDASYWHYALQTSIYRYILERNYDINVSNSRLVVMHPEINKAFVVDVPYMQEEVIAILNKNKHN